jgi:hypothetical protein
MCVCVSEFSIGFMSFWVVVAVSLTLSLLEVLSVSQRDGCRYLRGTDIVTSQKT